MSVAVWKVENLGAFPSDDYWQEVLGVDFFLVEEAMQDHGALASWLARQSQGLIARLEERAGLSPVKGSKRERADRLLASEAGRIAVRHAVLCRYYLVNRRKEALESALDSIIAARPSLVGLEAARGDWVRAVLEVADGAPECLMWIALWDRAVRVGYREYRLDQVGGQVITGSARELSISRQQVERAISRGFDVDALRCVDVVTDPRDAQHLIFILHDSKGRDRVRTLDGVRYVGRVEWIILRLTDQVQRLLVHSPGELGVRLAEAIVAEAAGGGPIRYHPYLPQTEEEHIAAWAEELVRREGEEICLYEIDLVLQEAPETTWSIRGDVLRALELITRGAKAASGTRGRVVDGESHGAAVFSFTSGLTRVSLGFRESRQARWSRFTLWVRPGVDGSTRIVTYRGRGVSAKERRSFLEWMERYGISCASI